MDINRFTLTNDLPGTLGVEDPVGVELTFGYFSFDPETCNKKAGGKDVGHGREIHKHRGIKVGLDIVELVTVNRTVWPGTYFKDDNKFGRSVRAIRVNGKRPRINGSLSGSRRRPPS